MDGKTTLNVKEKTRKIDSIFEVHRDLKNSTILCW